MGTSAEPLAPSRPRRPGRWSRARAAWTGARAAQLLYPFFVGVTVVVVVAADVAWRLDETRPPHFDMSGHLWRSLLFYDYLVHFHLFHFITGYFYYPPFTYWVADAFYVVLGKAMWVAVLSNVVFVAILAFSVYDLGRVLWSRRVGALAAVFGLAAPMVVTQFKEYQVDAPLTAMVALALAALVRTRAFANRKWSIALGIVAGLGILTKWTFPLPMALPAMIAVTAAVVAVLHARVWSRVANIALAALCAIIVASPWYAHNWSLLRADIRRNTLNPNIYRQYGDPDVLSVKSLSWYFWRLIDPQLYVPLLTLVVIGLAVTVWRRDALRRNVYPLALIASTYVAFSLLHHKDTRYTLPMIPGLAIVATHWVDDLPTRAARAISALIVAVCGCIFFVVSFGSGLLPKEVLVRAPYGDVALFAQRGYIIGPPTHEQWHQQELFADVHREKPGAAVFYSSPDTIWFPYGGSLYYSVLYGLRLVNDERDADFIIMRTDGPWRPPPAFRLERRVTLPDHTFATLAVRR